MSRALKAGSFALCTISYLGARTPAGEASAAGMAGTREVMLVDTLEADFPDA
jgi:hypothetical protein